jgi:UDP-4-amino-4,6-dideoxy-N-acetyl-beta-L-altrosamine N-acetyltransferase
MSLKYEDCRLRSMAEDDLEQVFEWRNSERIRLNMYTDQLISIEQHRAWFTQLQNDSASVYQIFEYHHVPAGIVNFTQIDKRSNKAYWGFYLGREDLPRGAGTLMGELGLSFAFNELKLRKLCGEAFAFNEASIRFHQKLGFVEEGRFKQHILKKNKYEDIVCFALFENNYREQRS